MTSNDAGRRFASNIGILLLNKHLLGGYGFRYPIFLTLCHMVACVVLSQVQPPCILHCHSPLQLDHSSALFRSRACPLCHPADVWMQTLRSRLLLQSTQERLPVAESQLITAMAFCPPGSALCSSRPMTAACPQGPPLTP